MLLCSEIGNKEMSTNESLPLNYARPVAFVHAIKDINLENVLLKLE